MRLSLRVQPERLLKRRQAFQGLLFLGRNQHGARGESGGRRGCDGDPRMLVGPRARIDAGRQALGHFAKRLLERRLCVGRLFLQECRLG